MAVITTIFGNNITGKFGDCVFYRYGDKVCVRKRPKATKPPSRKQIIHRNKFKATSILYSSLNNDLFRGIWNKANLKTGNGRALFVRKNINCFDENGKIIDYSILNMTDGRINNSPSISIEMLNNRSFKINWKINETIYSGDENDLLHLFIMYDDQTFRYLYIHDKNVRRKDGYMNVTLKDSEVQPIHLYCFFSSSDYKKFSPSRYMKLCWNH